MIALTRRQARRLRAAFRRHPLGIAHKGAVPPLVFRAEPGVGLRVRHHQPALAVECLLPGDGPPEGSVALPLDALADFEGKDDVPVVLEAADPGRTVVRWDDRGIPQAREYQVPALAGLPPFPAPPAAFEPTAAGLLDALAEAAVTTDEDSTRYALGCLQLRGTAGEVVATDGRQVLVQGGFRLPWDGDLLVRGTPLFACKDLARERPVAAARTDAHVAIRAGAWTIWLAIRADARFPRVDHLLPSDRGPDTRLRLDPGDAGFLRDALLRLPGGEAPNAPVTLDLNGRVAVRARDGGEGRVTELVLRRSRFEGDPVRLSMSRHFLARALGLGFAEVRALGPDDPVACRDGLRSYLWQPLSKDSAIAPADDATRIESAGVGPAEVPLKPGPEEVKASEPAPALRPVAATREAAPGTREVAASGGGPGGLAALIQEAAALHAALSDARARAGRLAVALRRHRRRERLVSSTLASLEALKLQGVGG